MGATFPVIAGGRFYVRDTDELLAYDISADAFTKPRIEPRTVAISLASPVSLPQGSAPPRTGRERAPDAVYVPTPEDIVEKMLHLAAIEKKDVIYDLGSGDGRVVIAAAAKYGCQAVGYEIDRRLVDQSRENVVRSKVESLVRIEHEDIFTLDLSGADVIAVYLPSALLERLLPQFEKLKPGSRIVSHQFEIPGLKPEQELTLPSKEDGEKHRLFLWTTPLKRQR
jgi:SAM-dependent methyltransferase